MITDAEIHKLAAVHAVEPTVLSLYLAVPPDPARLPGLPARAVELLAHLRPAGRLGRADREKVLAEVATPGRDWPGHGVAIFCCPDTSLFEVHQIPGRPPERAILGTRPHIRPLLTAIQRYPAYRVAVADRRHAWVLAISWDEIATADDPAAATMPSHAPAGWHGLEAYRVHEPVTRLARHHHPATADILAQHTPGEQRPLVIGGHHDGITRLLANLPPPVRDAFAGSFTADTHTLTPARVRELAAPVVSRWAQQRTQRVAADIRQLPPGHAVTGLYPCLTAVNADAAEILIVPDEALVAGYACGRCGALGTAADQCPDWGTAAQPVPDLIEEMITRTLDDGGQVCVVPQVPGDIAAKLRLPAGQSM